MLFFLFPTALIILQLNYVPVFCTEMLLLQDVDSGEEEEAVFYCCWSICDLIVQF